MQLSSLRISVCFLSYALCLAYCKNSQDLPAHLSSPLCLKHNLEDFILIRGDQCFIDANQLYEASDYWKSSVSEVNGVTLERALSLLQKRNDSHAAVLVYAKWCPFSKTLRPMFDILSSQFPGIYHFAVENSALRQSSISQFGLHSFPALFMHNKTLRVRYYGPRTVEAITRFYRNITGLQPVNVSHTDTDRVALIEQLSTVGVHDRKDSCPYPWVKSPEMWLHDDIYLTLAFAFIILRLAFYLLPKLLIGMKSFWIKEKIYGQIHRGFYRNACNWKQEPCVNPSTRNVNGCGRKKETMLDNKENGKGVLVVPGWSSVTLQGSSSKSGFTDESCENTMYKSHLWG